jgi:branched-chain amino acid transport system substrate-binding protein
VQFRTFYGGETGFYGQKSYGSRQQMRLPVMITQIKDGKLVQITRMVPDGD